MRYHIILEVEAKAKMEHISTILAMYNTKDKDKEQEKRQLPYLHFFDKIYKFELNKSSGNFEFRTEIIPKHKCYLPDECLQFVKDILVPLTDEISCTILHVSSEYPYNKKHYYDTHYTDDDIRDASYIVALRPCKPLVQYGKRVSIPKEKDEIVSFIKIYPNITDSDADSWPSSLQYWWRSMHFQDNPKFISKCLRECYGKDEELLRYADWIDANAVEGIKFEHRRRIDDY
jgi:hypothetical protein